MAGSLKKRLDDWQRRLTERIGSDIGTPKARRAARLHYLFIDHGWLRVLWRNFHQIAPGVYRCNQPSDRQLRAIHARVGLKSVLNLRGPSRRSFHLFEAETCRALGLTMVDLSLSASKAPTLDRLEQLVHHLQTLPKPFLIHCKSGADRTGLAAALYLLLIEGRPLAEAKAQLGFRFLHVANSPAGVQDHLLRIYEAAWARSGIGFLDWVRTAYDPVELTAAFARWRAGDRSLT